MVITTRTRRRSGSMFINPSTFTLTTEAWYGIGDYDDDDPYGSDGYSTATTIHDDSDDENDFEPREHPYTLLSLNILCGSFMDPIPIKRWTKQVNEIRNLNPDVICLQEFNNRHVEELYRRKLEDKYTIIVQRVPGIEYVRRMALVITIYFSFALISSTFEYIFWALLLHPYIHNFMIGSQETGNAILVRHDIVPRVSDIQVHIFDYQFEDPLNWIRRRGYIECVLDGCILVRNTHLNHQSQDPLSYLLQMKESFSEFPCDSVVVAGDFNYETIPYDMLYPFCDPFKHLGPTYRRCNPLTTCYGLRFLLHEDRRLDYIMYRDLVIDFVQKIDMYSDHDGLLMKFHKKKDEEILSIE